MATTAPVTPTAVHRDATRTALRDVASRLQTVLSRRVTAYLSGVREGKSVTRWATGEVAQIRDSDIERRLRMAYEICELLRHAGDSDQTVKAWFIGLDPDLGEAPIEALREGRLKEAYDASLAFIAGA